MRVLDETDKRRRVGLLSQTPVDQARLLLSPLYYIRRALEPFADLVEPPSPDLTEAIPQLLEQKPAVIVMGDVGTIPESVRKPLIEWMENGGTLVRFASSRLLSAGNDEELLPVSLRLGERSLGGALSWTQPQTVARVPAERSVLQPSAAVRRDGDAADPRRADAGPRRPHLGDARRRHPAGHWRPARQGHGRAVPRHAAGDMVEPADLRNLRGDAPPHRATVEKPGRGAPQVPTRPPSPRWRPTA